MKTCCANTRFNIPRPPREWCGYIRESASCQLAAGKIGELGRLIRPSQKRLAECHIVKRRIWSKLLANPSTTACGTFQHRRPRLAYQVGGIKNDVPYSAGSRSRLAALEARDGGSSQLGMYYIRRERPTAVCITNNCWLTRTYSK